MDRVSKGIELWARERPDLDTSGTEVVGRVLRLGLLYAEALEAALAPYGLRARAYSMLAILRTHGAPEYRLAPKALAQATFLTSGGLTNLLDRMDRAGLVSRHPDPNDGRAVAVQLTSRGFDLIERVAPEIGRVERELLAGLSAHERARLAKLLSRLLQATEPFPPARP